MVIDMNNELPHKLPHKLFLYSLSGILFTILTGTLSHFLYEWSGNNRYIGLITPVNESVWEHMKMVFFPMFLFCGSENIMLKKNYPYIYKANACAIYLGVFSIPVLFYTYSGILGKNYLAADIVVFCLSVILAFLFSYKLAKSLTLPPCPKTPYHRKSKIAVCYYAAVLLLFLCFILFTLYPPQDIGLFRTP